MKKCTYISTVFPVKEIVRQPKREDLAWYEMDLSDFENTDEESAALSDMIDKENVEGTYYYVLVLFIFFCFVLLRFIFTGMLWNVKEK